MNKNMTQAYRSGQVMLLSVLSIGAIMLGATAVAGLLMVYQLRTTSDVANSAKAIFAADAGIDWGLYQFSKPSSSAQPPVFSNGATIVTTCYNDSLEQVNCTESSVSAIKSSGKAGESFRAFELSL